MTETIGEHFQAIYHSIVTFVVAFSPRIGLALAIFIAGLIFANLTYWLTSRLFQFISPMLRWRDHKHSMQKLVSNTFYWIIIFTFAYWAVLSLELPFINTWLSNINKFIPQLVISILIILTGYVLSRIVRTAVIQVSGSATIQLTADLIAVFIITVSILSAIDQININASLINSLFLVTFTMLFGGVILLLIMASHKIVREMMSARFVSDTYDIGQSISVDKYEGVIESISSTTVRINQDGTIIMLPARFFLEHAVTIISSDNED